MLGDDVTDDVSLSGALFAQDRRDAFVAFTSGGCNATLVTPRVIVSAAHCGRIGELYLGQDASEDLDAPTVGTSACFVHPRVLEGVGVVRANCAEMQRRVATDVNEYDWVLYVLDRRIDSVHDTTLHAIPATISFDPVVPIGARVRWASYWHTDFDRGRVFAEGTLLDDLGWTLVTDFDGDVALRQGDSGSALHAGDPEVRPPAVLSVLSRGFDATDSHIWARPAWYPDVGDWLRSLTTDRAAGTYVGPADYPVRCDASRRAELPCDRTFHADDPDGDGLRSIHDVCPNAYDPDQLDFDRDGHGNECDGCPALRFGGPCEDPDGDEVCASCDNCPIANADQRDGDGDGVGDACDVSPFIPDPLQANCNADAEAAVGLDFGCRGDICDPVRCSETELVSWRSLAEDGVTIVQSNEGLNVDGRQADATETYGTGFRFCRCSAATLDSLEARDRCVASGCTIADVAAFDRGREDGPGWRRVTRVPSRRGLTPCDTWRDCVGGDSCEMGRCVAADLEAIVHEPLTGTRYDVDYAGRWALRDVDIPRWAVANPLETFPLGHGTAGALSGVMWTYPRFRSGGGTPDAARLPHNYWSGTVDGPRVVARYPAGYGCLSFLAPLIARSIGGGFGTGFPLGYVARPGIPGPNQCRAGSGSLVLASDVVTLEPVMDIPNIALFDEPVGQWVAAAETGAWLPVEGLRYAGVEPGAEMPLVRRALVETRFGLEPLDKLNSCPNCPCPSCAPLAFPMAGAPEPSALRTAAAVDTVENEPGVLVLSARRRTLWRIGGRDGGTARDTIGVYFPDTDSWQTIDVGGRLGHVLSATYSAPDDTLYVLSEVERRERGHGAGARRAVLLSLDPDDDTVTEIASWPRLAQSDELTMAVDAEGLVWIAGSRSDGRTYVAIRVDPRDGGRVRSSYGGLGRVLPYGARASDEGLTLPVMRSGTPALATLPIRAERERAACDRLF